jgi:hypothetical protein
VNERRRTGRFQPEEALYGRVRMALPAKILDISPHGARVEVASALRPTAECDVAVPAGAGELRLRARVVRCRALAGNPSETGGIVFRAGLEFVNVSEAAAAGLEAAYGEAARSEARSAHLPPPNRPPGPIKIRVNLDDITSKKE